MSKIRKALLILRKEHSNEQYVYYDVKSPDKVDVRTIDNTFLLIQITHVRKWITHIKNDCRIIIQSNAFQEYSPLECYVLCIAMTPESSLSLSFLCLGPATKSSHFSSHSERSTEAPALPGKLAMVSNIADFRVVNCY